MSLLLNFVQLCYELSVLPRLLNFLISGITAEEFGAEQDKNDVISRLFRFWKALRLRALLCPCAVVIKRHDFFFFFSIILCAIINFRLRRRGFVARNPFLMNFS